MIGEVKQIVHNILPDGWEFCDGQELSILGNRSLFELIGNIYGGDGIETFKLPDFRNRVLVHVSDSKILHKNGGFEKATLVDENIPNHYHNIDIPVNTTQGDEDESSPGNGVLANINVDEYASEPTDGKKYSGKSIKSESFGSGESFSIMQPYSVVNFIINVDDK